MPAYYLVVHSDAGPIGLEFLEHHVRPKVGNLTYGELAESDEYKRVALYSHRNARRLLADAADHLGLSILHTSDSWAKVEEGSFDAPPTLGIEQIDTPYNLLRVMPNGNVVFYARSTHLGSCTGDHVAYLVDPAYGVLLYRGDATRRSQQTGAWSNAMCSAFPISTGRILDSTIVDANRKRMNRERLTREYLNTIVQWRGRADTTPALSHERLGAYRDFKEEHSTQLGATFGYVRLKPVCLVTAPPAAK
jgi:hypothetical protein